MLQKSGRLVLWEAMFILELHSAETQERGLTKPPETDTLKKPYMSGCHAVVMKLGLTQWKSTNRVRLGTKQH